jgi:NADH-quinone oxidoreductase subunit E
LQLQAKKRWLPRHALQWVARRLGVPLARVYEVASFYEAFSLVPQGAHTLQVCMGTSCHVRRAPELSATVSAVLGVPPGGTDAKMMFTFKQVNCLGCCALAPVMTLDKQYHSNPSLKELRRILREAEAGTLGEAGGAGTGGGAGGDAGEETEETSESAEARP